MIRRVGRTAIVTAVIVATSGCAFLERASTSSAPARTEAKLASDAPSLSASGRWVAFASEDSHLVANDTNAASDVFVHDNVTGATERVSTDGGGAQANGVSSEPSISDDGRYVAFTSTADLAPDGNDNGAHDVFVKDRITGAVTVASVGEVGAAEDAPTAAPASFPVLSGDGRSVAFQTSRFRQVPDTPPIGAIPFGPYVRDLDAATTTLLPGPSLQNFGVVTAYDLSDDGGRIVYQEVDPASGFRATTTTATVDPVATFGVVESHPTSPLGPFPPSAVAISGDGTRYAVIANPTSGEATRYLGSVSDPTHPDEVATMPVAPAVFLSTDGATVGWETTLFAGPIVVVRSPGHDPEIVTRSSDGKRIANGRRGAMSADGRFVAFVSTDPALVADDQNGVADVFTRGVSAEAGKPS